MKKQNILVIGGTGKTGRRIAALLETLGHNVRIGSRNAQLAFDWDKPEDWSQALEGMDKVYITYQPDLAVPGAMEAIERLVKEAKNKSIKKLVLLSGKGEREEELCEQIVIHSGLDYTIVRASWFNQNFNESFFLEPILDGFVALPKADILIPFVDADDIAEVAVQALIDDAHNGKIYQLTGPEVLTLKEAIAIIAEARNQTIAFVPISVDEYTDGMRKAGVPEDFVWLIGYLFTAVLDNPQNSEVTDDVAKVLNRPPISFADYARKTASTGVWNVGSKQTV